MILLKFRKCLCLERRNSKLYRKKCIFDVTSNQIININIYIHIYKSRDLRWESMRFCQVAYCMTFFSFRLSISSKFSIYVKLLSNDKCIYFNILIKFKEFVYIYNLTYFKLIRIDLKNHEKCRNQKNFSIFCVRLTSM